MPPRHWLNAIQWLTSLPYGMAILPLSQSPMPPKCVLCCLLSLSGLKITLNNVQTQSITLEFTCKKTGLKKKHHKKWNPWKKCPTLMNRMFILYSLLVLSKKKQITNKNFYSIATPKAMAHTGTPTVYHQSSATCADSHSMFNSRTGRAQIHSQLIQIQICPQAHTNKHITDTHTHTHSHWQRQQRHRFQFQYIGHINFDASVCVCGMFCCCCPVCGPNNNISVAVLINRTQRLEANKYI